MTIRRRNQMLYGINQADEWWPFAEGEHRETIRARIKETAPKIFRVFLFDKHGPSPVTMWPDFERYIKAVLDVGATPMITFAKMDRPFDDPRAVREFAERCGDTVWCCIDRWGADLVKDWFWAVWNEPNSTLIGGGLGFDQYARIYEAVARRCLHWLRPYLGGKRPRIGGPGIEAFQPLWMDWAYRFVTETDPELVGFLDWHTYGEWREEGQYGAPTDPGAYRSMMLWATQDFESRARLMSRLTKGRGIMNICGEHNSHSHQSPDVRRRFNYSEFTAAFCASSLLNLIRGGADAELFWTGIDGEGGYGMLDLTGAPRPVFYAKKLVAAYVRTGDTVTFPVDHPDRFDVVVAEGDDGRKSALVVNLQDGAVDLPLSELAPGLDPQWELRLDRSTEGVLASGPHRGGGSKLEGFGISVLTNGRDPTV